MSKKQAKKHRKIKDTSKTYLEVDPKEVAKALGAKQVITLKDIQDFRKRFVRRPH